MGEWFTDFFRNYYASSYVFIWVFIGWVNALILLVVAKVITQNNQARSDIVKSARSLVITLGFSALIISGLLIPIDAYVSSFGDRQMSAEPGGWGPVGDFFGGMLNPILAFASFIALLYTIRIQSEELRLTREEFEKASTAQSESAGALKGQLDESRKQYLMAQYHDLFSAIARDLNEFMHISDVKTNNGNAESYNQFMVKVLHVAMTHQECKTPEWIYQVNANIKVQMTTRAIIQRLARLSHLLSEYADHFGSTAVYRDYLFQFTEITAILHFTKVLDARFESFQVFNIDEFYESAGFCMLDTPKN